jgi:hypothetical protein
MVCNSRHTNESNHTGSEVKLEGSQRYVHPVEGSQGALEKWLVLRAAQGHQPRSQPPPPPRYQGGRLAAEESESRLVPQGWPCVLALRPRAMLTWTWS